MMKNKYLRKLTIMLSFVSIVSFGVLIYLMRTSVTYNTTSVKCPPGFSYEVAFESETGTKEYKQSILILSEAEYSTSNINTLLLCYSATNKKAKTMIVRLFTNKDLALQRNFFVSKTWRHLLKAYPYDATLITRV